MHPEDLGTERTFLERGMSCNVLAVWDGCLGGCGGVSGYEPGKS